MFARSSSGNPAKKKGHFPFFRRPQEPLGEFPSAASPQIPKRFCAIKVTKKVGGVSMMETPQEEEL
jgi:hypothetical protein